MVRLQPLSLWINSVQMLIPRKMLPGISSRYHLPYFKHIRAFLQ